MVWLLTRKKHCGYDEYDSFVVRADTEQEARELCTKEEETDYKAANHWLEKIRSTCKPLHAAGETGVILGSFNAG